MNTIKSINFKAIGETILFGLMVYSATIFIVPLFDDYFGSTKALSIIFGAGLLVCYYIALQYLGSVYERKLYICTLVLGFFLWIAIKSAGFYPAYFEIVFFVGYFLLIYLGTKR